MRTEAEKQPCLGSRDTEGYPQQLHLHFPRDHLTDQQRLSHLPRESSTSGHLLSPPPAGKDPKSVCPTCGDSNRAPINGFLTPLSRAHTQLIQHHPHQKTLDLPVALTCPGQSRDQRHLCRRAAPGRSAAPQDRSAPAATAPGPASSRDCGPGAVAPPSCGQGPATPSCSQSPRLGSGTPRW